LIGELLDDVIEDHEICVVFEQQIYDDDRLMLVDIEEIEHELLGFRTL
jgi:hypothetical protein